MEFINNFIEKSKDNEENAKTLISNEDYIVWLSKFTIKNTRFTDEMDWFSEKLDLENKKNIYEISIFYDEIKAYADNNGIKPTLCELGNFYKIKYNDRGFKIGKLEYDGYKITFCNTNNITLDDSYIAIENIIAYMSTQIKEEGHKRVLQRKNI